MSARIRNTRTRYRADDSESHDNTVTASESPTSAALSDDNQNADATAVHLPAVGVETGVEVGTGPRQRKGLKRPYIKCGETGCWLWQRGTTEDGYAYFKRNGLNVLAHRYYYQLHIGPIPIGLTLDHLCRVRHCVNPAHLDPVTQLVNTHRGERCKINAGIAKEIRIAIRSGERHKDIAPRYGISKALVHHIATDRVWTVPEAYPETSGAGFEPATTRLEGADSIQLSYPDSAESVSQSLASPNTRQPISRFRKVSRLARRSGAGAGEGTR